MAEVVFVGRGIAEVRGIAGCDRQWKKIKIMAINCPGLLGTNPEQNAPPERGDASFWWPRLFLLAGASPRSILVAAALPAAVGSVKKSK